MSDNLLMLLEMIEEVLEEQNKDPEALVNIYAKQFGLDYVGFSKSTKSHIYKLPKGQFDREVPAEKINNELENNGFNYRPYASSGKSKQTIGATIYDGRKIGYRYAIKKGPGGPNLSEVMESVIAQATGGNVGNTFQDPLKNAIRAKYEKAIKDSVEASGLLNQKLTKQGNGIISDAFGDFGVQSKVPKTDLIDPTKNNRYSVKREGGAQFISAQGPESAAIWDAAAKKVAGGKINDALTAGIIQATKGIKEKFKYEQWSQIAQGDRATKKKLYDSIKQDLFTTITTELGLKNEAFKRAFIYEGLTGEQKFKDVPPKANLTLTWGTSGEKFKIKNIDTFIDNTNFRIRVSDRGGTRGGSLRGDILEDVVDLSDNSYVSEQQLQQQTGETPTQPRASAPTTPPPSDEDKYIDAKIGKLNNFLIRKFAALGLTKFLDYILADTKEGEINMVPLYQATSMQPEFADFIEEKTDFLEEQIDLEET
jgi:hypothetical protein